MAPNVCGLIGKDHTHTRTLDS